MMKKFKDSLLMPWSHNVKGHPDSGWVRRKYGIINYTGVVAIYYLDRNVNGYLCVWDECRKKYPDDIYMPTQKEAETFIDSNLIELGWKFLNNKTIPFL